MKLYETYFEIEQLWSMVGDILSGEVTEGPDGLPVTPEDALDMVEKALSGIEDERDAKALNIAAMIKNHRAEAEALKSEKARLARRQQAAESTVAWLIRYLEQFIEPGLKLKDARSTIGWRRSEGVKLTVSPDDLPEKFTRIKREANLTAIKEVLKSGNPVPGAMLDERHNIQIR